MDSDLVMEAFVTILKQRNSTKKVDLVRAEGGRGNDKKKRLMRRMEREQVSTCKEVSLNARIRVPRHQLRSIIEQSTIQNEQSSPTDCVPGEHQRNNLNFNVVKSHNWLST